MFDRWSMIIVLYFVFYRDKHRVYQYDNTVGLEFDLDLLVAELAASGTCRGKFATRGSQAF